MPTGSLLKQNPKAKQSSFNLSVFSEWVYTSS